MRTALLTLSLTVALVAGGCDHRQPEIESMHPPVLVVRSDFSDDVEWERLKETLQKPIEQGYVADVQFLEVRHSADQTASEIAKTISPPYRHSFIFMADRHTFESDEATLLIADLTASSELEFRLLPSKVAEVEANLSIANLSFEDFMSALDEKGVYRGL